MATTVPTGGGYRDILMKLADTLKPGGETEKSYIAEAEQEGKSLAAQLNASSIARGLGNATNNAPVVAAKHVAKRKQEIRGNMLQQLLSTLQFLANMGFQEEQATESRKLQREQNALSFEANRGPSNASRGLDVFGQPFMSLGGQGGGDFSANAYPSLAAAGGMGGSRDDEYVSPFGSVTSSTYTAPTEIREWGDPYFIGGRDVTKG